MDDAIYRDPFERLDDLEKSKPELFAHFFGRDRKPGECPGMMRGCPICQQAFEAAKVDDVKAVTNYFWPSE